jgi:predicted enzyme related to lactoylglutathione lyase
LGIQREPHGQGAALYWREDQNPARRSVTTWAVFEKHSKYFEPSRAPFMLNSRVDDLDALLEALRAEGVTIDPKREDYDYGRFAWIIDPEGNKIELWEPPR